MKGVSVIILLGLCSNWASAQFLNHRPFPTFSLENMPDTDFSCRDKILGGYYADAQTECQMFHICVKVAGVGVQDFRFLCPNGTAFDQDHQICAEWEDVDCDATTLYYSSDNFDLYRIGSGFESKAVKYGEDEETFSLQRAETGDARLNREHQAHRVNQQKEQQFRKQKQQQQNSDRDIFKGSSSSNFFNNKNGGKETDEDYDDTVNANQDRDPVQKRKLIRKQNRRPLQDNDDQYNPRSPQNIKQQNENRQNNNEEQYNQRRPQNNRQQTENSKSTRQQQNNNRQQNEEFESTRQPQNNNRQQNEDFQGSRQQQNRQNDYQNNRQQQQTRHNEERQQNAEAPTTRSSRPTGFVNNFAGSSYIPTTSRPSSTTINAEQYTTAVNNHRTRNGQRHRVNPDRQYNNAENFRQNSPTPNYTVSTPAPFKQTQQYNSPPNRPTTQDNGQYKPTTQAPQKETENYPANFPKQTNYPTTPQKFSPKQTENYPTQPPVTRNTQYNTNNAQYDVPKVKQTENYPTQAPSTRNTQHNTQYDTPKVNKQTKQTENYPTQAPSTRNTQYNTQYDVPKAKQIKQTENYPTTPFRNTENYSTQFNKKPTTPVKQTDNYPTTFAPKVQKTTQQFNYPSTFAPRTNSAYTQISKQTTQYQQNAQSQKSTAQSTYTQQSSTPRTSPFTQYTPTVPKISTTTPVSRSNRFDETQYDDGSYNSKYDNREDEFLKTAHSQNIASSRNELAKTTKNVAPSTQKPQYESPRPFSVSPNTPKVSDYPKSTPKSVNTNAPSGNKKVKDASYDYAYYDTNVGSEPEYEIDTDIKKSTAKN